MLQRTSVFVLLTLVFAFSVNGQNMTKGPYLADPQLGSISIRWELDQENTGKVYYGQNSKLKHKVKARLLGKVSGHYLYEAKLTDLLLDATYKYQVKIGRKKGDVYTFQAPPDAQASCSFAISGDSRSQPKIFSQIVAGISNSDPDFVISMGDLVENGGNFEQWDKFYFGPAEKLIAERPFISTLGDHEGSGDDGALFNHYLFPELEYEKLWYSFDYGMVHFVSLDYRHADSEKMQDWFRQDMAASKGKWNVVFMHRPTYNLGGHRSFWGNPDWPDLFREYRVDVVFGGHSHIYERFYPVYSGEQNSWTITYITTGGSGAGLYEAIQHPVLAYAKSTNHYADVKVSAESFELQVYEIDGTPMDSLVITKNANGTQADDYLASARSRRELDIMGVFAGPISWSLDSPPLFHRPANKEFNLNAGSISEPIKFKLRLSETSLPNYKMEPYVGELIPGQNLEILLKIWGKSDLKVSGWGQIDPPFRIIAEYEQDKIKGAVQGKSLRMRSWGE